jgi:transposase
MTVLHMSQKELTRLDTLQRVDRGDLHADDAAFLLGVSRRQVFRLLDKLRRSGAEGLVSTRRGRPSNRRFDESFLEQVLGLVRDHYPDFGPSFAAEKLEERHGIRISRETLWTCNGLVPVTCLSLCHLGLESQGAYAAQI